MKVKCKWASRDKWVQMMYWSFSQTLGLWVLLYNSVDEFSTKIESMWRVQIHNHSESIIQTQI